MTLLFILLLIVLIPLLLGGRILSAILGLFFPRRMSQEKEANRKKETKSRGEKVDIKEVNLRRFDKDQGEYVDFEEEKCG